MKITFLDMKAQYIELKEDLDKAYYRFMESGWYVLGEEVDSFEREFAEYTGTDYSVGVSNGLDAIVLALKALDIGVGDEIIVPANTYIATWLAVSQVGAIPIPVEPDIETFNIDPKKIETAISSKTKAIIAVHLYGRSADMTAINRIAKEYDLYVLEDNAQSQGAMHGGKRTGNLSDIGAVSFYPAKNLGAFGEAGAITTNSRELAEKVSLLRNYGSRKKYYNEVKGYNRRIDALQAAFLRVKLKKLDQWNQQRTIIAKEYSNNITNCTLPFWDSNAVWHQYVVLVEDRSLVQEKLGEKGIPTMIHYPVPPYLSDAYSDLGYKEGSFPITENIASYCLSLPIGPHMSLDECEYVIEVFNSTIN